MKKSSIIILVSLYCVLIAGCNGHVPMGGQVTYTDTGEALEQGTIAFYTEDGLNFPKLMTESLASQGVHFARSAPPIPATVYGHDFLSRGEIREDGRFDVGTMKDKVGLP